MKIKLKDFFVEIEFLFLIVIFISIFSFKIRNLLKYFYLCYLFIIFHEMSHIFIGNIFGKEIEKINFCISGVNAKFQKKNYYTKENKNYLIEIIIYLAGPISNIILALLFKKVKIIFDINIFLAFINLLPIYPLDGYNILNYFIKLNNFKKIDIKYISNIFYILLFILSILEIIIFKSFSLIVFAFYLYIINIEYNKKVSYNAETCYLKMM